MPDTESARPQSRRARSSLTLEGILDAAEVVAARGFDALTIRAVAIEIESSPMALYRYFATKDELVDALLNRVLGRVEFPGPTDDWIADLRTFALAHRTVLTEHGWAIVPLTMNPNPGPNAAQIGEAALRILHRAEIDEDDAVATFSGLIALNYGWAAFVAGRQRAEASNRRIEVALPPSLAEMFPITASVADAMSRYGSDEHYALVLSKLLAGIEKSQP